MIYNETKYTQKWETCKLDSLGDFSRGKSKHRPRNDKKLFEGGGYPLIQTGEVKQANLYINSHKDEYNEFGLAQSKMWDAGTLCITIAANIAETALLGYPMCFPDSVVGFNADKEKTSELFMHYVFTYIKKSIQNSVVGSIQDNINLEYLQNLDFKIPPKQYQDKIVSVLTAIDKQIDVCEKFNSEIDAILKYTFEYWFVQYDFPNEDKKPYFQSKGEMIWCEELQRNIPKGWKVEPLSSCIENINTGLNPRDNFVFKPGPIRYLTVKNLTTEGIIDYTTCDTIDEEARQVVHNRSDIRVGDILFASIAPLGRCYLIQEEPVDWDINESIFSIRTNCKRTTPEFLYLHFLSDLFVKGGTSSSTGSIFKGIRINTLSDMLACVPPKSIADEFSDRVKPLFSLKSKKEKEVQELLQLRDWLLPLLMNGQVTIT